MCRAHEWEPQPPANRLPCAASKQGTYVARTMDDAFDLNAIGQGNVEDNVAACSERAKIRPQILARLAQQRVGGQQNELSMKPFDLMQRRVGIMFGDVIGNFVEVGVRLAGESENVHWALRLASMRRCARCLS